MGDGEREKESGWIEEVGRGGELKERRYEERDRESGE